MNNMNGITVTEMLLTLQSDKMEKNLEIYSQKKIMNAGNKPGHVFQQHVLIRYNRVNKNFTNTVLETT